jgi:hypothetical protein
MSTKFPYMNIVGLTNCKGVTLVKSSTVYESAHAEFGAKKLLGEIMKRLVKVNSC